MSLTERFVLAVFALLLGVAGIVTIAVVAVCNGHDGVMVAGCSSAITAVVTAIVSRGFRRPTKQAQEKDQPAPVPLAKPPRNGRGHLLDLTGR